MPRTVRLIGRGGEMGFSDAPIPLDDDLELKAMIRDAIERKARRFLQRVAEGVATKKEMGWLERNPDALKTDRAIAREARLRAKAALAFRDSHGGLSHSEVELSRLPQREQIARHSAARAADDADLARRIRKAEKAGRRDGQRLDPALSAEEAREAPSTGARPARRRARSGSISYL